jgi:hypothetical protein
MVVLIQPSLIQPEEANQLIAIGAALVVLVLAT